MLTFEFRDTKGILHKWVNMNLPSSMVEAMRQALLSIQSHSKAHYLTGPRPQKLGVVKDILRTSLYTRAQQQGDDIIGTIGTNVWYGHMWEVTGNPRVKQFPYRPFLKPAIDDKAEEVRRYFRDAIMQRIER